MRRAFLPALLLATALHAPAQTRAQQVSSTQLTAHFGDVERVVSLGSREQIDAAVEHVAASNGLRSLGPDAWPLVREYVWLSTYETDDFFAGYAHPLTDGEADELAFQLLVDRAAWSVCEPAVRQKKIFEARTLFEDRMAELNLKGSLHIVLTSR